MLLKIGNIYEGDVKHFNSQYITTQYFRIGIPLVPTKSVFYNSESNTNIEIPLNRQSIATYYVPFVIFILGAFILFIGFTFLPPINRSANYAATLLGYWPPFIIFTTVGSIFYMKFFYAKTTKLEKQKRMYVGKILSINALPEYLSHKQQQEFFKHLVGKLPDNWLRKCNSILSSSPEFSLYYTALLYLNASEDPKKHAQLLIDFETKHF